MTRIASKPLSANGDYASEPIGPQVAQHGGLIEVRAILQGVTPLLMNAMSEQQLLDIRGRVKPSKTAAKPSLREEAESKLHRMPDGRPHIPIHVLMSCLINAGQFIRLDGKRQVSTAQKTILPGMLTILDAELPLFVPGKPEESATWEVDIQRGRNPNGGEAVCLVRPRFDHWALECGLEIDQAQMPLPMARELVETAGKRVGFLEFRPQCKGTFGRFAIVNWEVVKKE